MIACLFSNTMTLNNNSCIWCFFFVFFFFFFFFKTDFMRTGTFLVIELGKVCILYSSLFWIFFTMKNYNMRKIEIVLCVFMWNSVSCFSKNTMKSLDCFWYKHFIETICRIFIEFSLKKANFPQQIVPEAINPVLKKKKIKTLILLLSQGLSSCPLFLR